MIVGKGLDFKRWRFIFICFICLALIGVSCGAEPAFAASSVRVKAPVIKVKTTDSTKIRVKITKVKGADGYRVYRSTKKSGDFKLVKSLKPFSTKTKSFTDTGLKPAKRYYYIAKAYTINNRIKKYSSRSEVKTDVTKVRGNGSEYDVKNVKFVKSKLNGKTAYFLGSSVTKGMKAENKSFVELLKKKYGMKVKKKAVNGTTLVGTPYNTDEKDKSYVARLTREMKDYKAPDYFVCQLSTNDASKGSELGSITPNAYTTKELKHKTNTVAGAIEYIAAFSQENWNCPVIFYVQTKFKKSASYKDRYLDMIDILYQASDKWGYQIQILNMWDDKNCQYTSKKDRNLCMYDRVHPTKAGYLLKYLPAFEKFLLKIYRTVLPKETQEKNLTQERILNEDQAQPESPDNMIDQEVNDQKEITLEDHDGTVENEQTEQNVDDPALTLQDAA